MEIAKPTELPFCQSYAFIISIKEYKQVPKLQAVVSDARKLAKVLERDQHFHVNLPLLNTKVAEIRPLPEHPLEKEVEKMVAFFSISLQTALPPMAMTARWTTLFRPMPIQRP